MTDGFRSVSKAILYIGENMQSFFCVVNIRLLLTDQHIKSLNHFYVLHLSPYNPGCLSAFAGFR